MIQKKKGRRMEEEGKNRLNNKEKHIKRKLDIPKGEKMVENRKKKVKQRKS